MRILGPEVGLGVTDFFVVSVGRFAAVDAGVVVIVVDSLAGDVVGVEVTLCYKKSNYFLSLRPGFALVIQLTIVQLASRSFNL